MSSRTVAPSSVIHVSSMCLKIMESQVVPSYGGAGFGVYSSQLIEVNRILGVLRRGEEPGRGVLGMWHLRDWSSSGYEL
jgi:hypothetical protein